MLEEYMRKNKEYRELTREEEEILKAKKKKRAAIWDKITTGLLVFIMASPVLILGYIVWWFLSRTLV